MKRRSGSTGVALLAGGIALLTVYQLLLIAGQRHTFEVLSLAGGAIVGYVVLGCGVYSLAAARRTAAVQPLTALPSPAGASDGERRVHGLHVAFMRWLDERAGAAPYWPAFDQFVREWVAQVFEAPRVRCFLVTPGGQRMRPLSGGDARGELELQLRGTLGQAAATGRPLIADRPAERGAPAIDWDSSAWQIVWPVRESGATIGLLAASDSSVLSRRPRSEVEACLTALSVCWRDVACRERLRVAELTDKGSGVITRRDFFDAAEHVLDGAYREREPVAVAVISLEGLRRLDDQGSWSARDRLIECVGAAMRRRMRADDVVGRFSDERFALLLRRLDGALGTLIVQKIVQSVQEEIAAAGAPCADVHVRAGLSASGAGRGLDELLIAAIDAADRARARGVEIEVDATLEAGAAR